MKSQYVDMLMKVAEGIIADAMLAYPQDGGLAKDLATLSRLVKNRGIGIFQFDLPALDDLLLESLRSERLCPHGPLSKVVSKRIQVPRFLSGLWLRIFDKTGCLLQDVDVNAILFIRQFCLVFKKLKLPCSPKRLESVVNEYRIVDQSLRHPSHDWASDSFVSSHRSHSVHFCDALALSHGEQDLPYGGSEFTSDSRDEKLLLNLQRCADELSAHLDQFNAFSASCGAKNKVGAGRGVKHGPGAVAHKSGVVDKYDFTDFSLKLSRVFPRIFCIPKNDNSETRNHEVPARLIAVPKTAKGPRLIAAEPVENQWFQQLMLNWFNNQFKHKLADFIDLSDQETSQKMAQRGSLTGHLATVDLSSASDRLSCWTVERIFRNNFSVLTALQSCRTRWIHNKIMGTHPYYLIQRKYASQGTACTFPVQTFVFLAIALSVVRGNSLEEKLRLNKGEVRVFGDDIILPSYGYSDLRRLMTLLQLKINESKSFADGHFRESCGGDFYRGFDVTPVKVSSVDPTKPELRASLVDSSNNFFKKGFWRTAERIGYLLPKRVANSLPVVSLDSGTVGLCSFVGSWYSHLPLRWKADTHTVEYRAWGLRTRPQVVDRNGRSRLRKFLLENPISTMFDESQYSSDLLERTRTRDGVAWRALNPITGFRANRLG